MKRNNLVLCIKVFISCILLTLITGCENSEINSVDLTLNKTGNVQFSLSKSTTSDGVDTVTAILTRSGHLSVRKNLYVKNSSATVTINDLASGPWQLLVEAKKSDGDALYRGNVNVDIKANKMTYVNINLASVHNVGNLSINVTWKQSDGTLFTKHNAPVIDIGGAGTMDNKYVYIPSVIYDGNLYKMWYSSQDISLNYNVCYAYSNDGINWTKKTDAPVINKGASGEWDSHAITNPTIVFDGSGYKAWYLGSDGSHRRIGFAESADGINWTKHPANPVLDIGSIGEWDSQDIADPYVVYTGTEYKIWYSGKNTNWKIGLAVSQDGVNWTKSSSNPVVSNGSSGAWDDKDMFSPCVIFNGSSYKMWYAGDNGSTRQIGLAESTDGINWTKHNDNPLLSPGSSGSWDQKMIGQPSVLYDGVNYRMWYGGYNGTIWRIGYATSGI